MANLYKKGVVGGTFDFLHKGHQKLLLEALKLAEHITIGLTTDSFNKRRNKLTYYDQKQRLNTLIEFLREVNLINRVDIIFINDAFGNATTSKKIEVIIVTPETFPTAEILNQKRIFNQLLPLKIVQIDHVKDETGEIISSTRIRNGEISSDGLVFKTELIKIAGKELSEPIREYLKKPLGKLIQIEQANPKLKFITVGDVTTQNFLKNGFLPDLAIADLKTKREQSFISVSELGFKKSQNVVEVTNKPGEISKQLIETISDVLTKKTTQVIKVTGEEDLAVLPAILLSPLNTSVFYGQPNEGLVEVKVTPEEKTKILTLLKT